MAAAAAVTEAPARELAAAAGVAGSRARAADTAMEMAAAAAKLEAAVAAAVGTVGMAVPAGRLAARAGSAAARGDRTRTQQSRACQNGLLRRSVCRLRRGGTCAHARQFKVDERNRSTGNIVVKHGT